MHLARDIMTHEVVVLAEGEAVIDAIRTLLNHRIGGAPVVAKDGSLVGQISELQLLGALYLGATVDTAVARWMTKNFDSATPTTPLKQLVDTMLVNRIRRIPIVDGQRIVGIIGRRDLLKFALATSPKLMNEWFCVLVDNADSTGAANTEEDVDTETLLATLGME